MMLALAFVAISCTKEDPDHDHEEELITTLTMSLTDTSGTITSFTFQDIDGDGGNAPTIDTITLSANGSYTCAITLLNESETPAEDMTSEILEEASEHQFFFSSTKSDLTVSYSDTDSNNLPIGLATTLESGATGMGNLTVTLKHEPSKTGVGVSEGDITNAGGETDIEVVFHVIVE